MVKGQRDRIDTVALVRGCRESFSVKHVSQVTTAVRTGDLCTPHAMGEVVVSRNSSWDGIEKRWPSTPTLTLGPARVLSSLTSSTVLDSPLNMLILCP